MFSVAVKKTAKCCTNPLNLKKHVFTRLNNTSRLLYSTSASDDWQYLEKSVAPTDLFQRSLPRLPIPDINDTLDRYARSQEVILTPREYEHTLNCSARFLKNSDMHTMLKKIDRANKHTNYVSEPWFDMYLNSRLPLVLNFNPFMTFKDDPRPEYRTQLVRSTNMVISSLRMLRSMKENLLKPEVYHLDPKATDKDEFLKFCKMFPSFVSFYAAMLWSKQSAFPLDMSQYKNLFASTRIPRHEKDELVTYPDSKHLLVLRNGHFYVFDVLDENGNIKQPEVIMSHINHIQQQTEPPPEYPVTVLSAEERNMWANCREQLLNAGNEVPLQLIDSALFVLVLDDTMTDNPNEITRQFLHGDGVNRWFDKSFSLIMMKNSTSCVNFEHAWGDGVAVLRYFNEVFKDSIENSFVHPSTQPADVNSAGTVQRLDFELDPHLKESIKKSKENFDKRVGALDVHHLEYTKYSKQYVKAKGIGPDSFMQLAIQMAYYRQYGQFVGTYESCSTSAFKHGRTETLRSATKHTKLASQLFVHKSKATHQDLLNAMMNCSIYHNSLTKEAAMGKGWDRHLFALKTLCEKHGITGEAMEIFEDPSYAKINHNILSTSTLSSPAVVIGGFGPVVQDGYGIGYGITNERIGFNVSSFPPHTNVRDFIECLRISLDQMHEVMEGNLPTRPS